MLILAVGVHIVFRFFCCFKANLSIFILRNIKNSLRL